MWIYDAGDLSVLAANAVARTSGVAGTTADAISSAMETIVVPLDGSHHCLIAAETSRDIDEASDAAGEWVFEIDVDGRITSCSAAVEPIIGYSPEEVVGRDFTELYFPESREKVRQFFDHLVAARTGWTNLVQRLRHRDGTECYVEASAVPVFDDAGQLVAFRGSDRDVTRRTRSEQKLRHAMRRDPLSGLPNRFAFQESMAARLGTADETLRAVLVIDLDHFKVLNDTFGHGVGDNALQVVASIIRSVAPDADFVARVGSDEFAVFVDGIEEPGEAVALARRITGAISLPVALEGGAVHVSATVGIAIAPCDGDSAAALLRSAEHALYRAKELGRGRVQLFTRDMREEQARRTALEADLRRALDRNELVLHYQPIYDCVSWGIIGVEALLRWQHPARGLLGPDQFIGIAETSGQIVRMGEWVLRRACMDVQTLSRAAGHAIRVSVNISARQLQEPELIESIREIVSETGLDPRLLELEITESVAMQNAEATLAALRALKDMGVSLAVDDFGTGYSSLLYLTRFPIDTVKVDRQFVGNVTRDESAAAVVGAVVALAHSLQLKTVAEGVETPEQRDFLLSHMCAEMQGFLFARPVEIGVLVARC